MRRLFTVVATLLVLNCGFATVVDDNLCATECTYCCRNQVCQTQAYCSTGNTNYYAIIGGVAGGIVGLIVLRVIYVKVIRPRCCMSRAAKESDEPKSQAYRQRRAEEKEKEKEKRKKKKATVGGKKKKKANNDDIESKGEKKPEKYDQLAANSVTTPNASILNKPEINGSIISQSKQELNLENEKATDANPRSRSDFSGPPKDQAISKGTKPSSSSNKNGEKRSSSKPKSSDKSKQSGDRSKSKEKSGGSNIDRSKSKEKSGSITNTNTKKKDNMNASTKSKKDDDDAKKAALEQGANQV